MPCGVCLINEASWNTAHSFTFPAAAFTGLSSCNRYPKANQPKIDSILGLFRIICSTPGLLSSKYFKQEIFLFQTSTDTVLGGSLFYMTEES